MNFCAKISFLFLFAGCSLNLTRGIPQEYAPENSNLFFKEITLVYEGQNLLLDTNLMKAYSNSVYENAHFGNNCYGKAKIFVDVKNHVPHSAWSVPLAIIPFWPIMPVNETWFYKMHSQIYCDDQLVAQIEFLEEKNIKAKFYGKLRSDLVNEASQNMHQSLIFRLGYELNLNRMTDQNIKSDY